MTIALEEKRVRNNESQKRRYWKDPEKARERKRQHHWKHREERNAYNRQYRKDNLEKEKAREKRYKDTHKKELKKQTLTHYGNGKCACVKCGESRLACLSIDHIKGGGSKEFKRTGLGGVNRYLKLRQDGYPKGYQTLCMNCQFIKRIVNNELQR